MNNSRPDLQHCPLVFVFYLLHTSSSPPHDQRLLSSRSNQIDEDKNEEENGDKKQEDVEEIHITGSLQVYIRARV